MRVVLAWDADATDVDLHVIDPNGDEVYYGRNPAAPACQRRLTTTA